MITVATTIQQFFENRDELMFPANGDKFLYFKTRNSKGNYLDVIERLDNGKYKVLRDSTTYRHFDLKAHIKAFVYYEREKKEPTPFEKMETQEELINRIAPRQHPNLAARYETRRIH